MRNTYYLPLLVLAVSLPLLTACKRSEDSKALPPPIVLVKEAITRDVPVYREWTGTLDGSENTEIRARVSGYLTRRAYQEGGFVKKGEVLFEIDKRPFEAALAEAKSQLEQVKAMQVASQADAERSKELFEKRAISEKEFVNKTQLNEANRAKVEAVRSAVEQAQLNVEFCTVTSPIDGIAGVAKAQIGDLVGASGSAVLTSVSAVDPMKVLFPISEVEYLAAAERVQKNLEKPLEQRAEIIELVLAGGKTFGNKARLFSVDRQVNASTGTILVTALVNNPGGLLRPGQFARARIVAEVLEGAVVVPQAAVMEVQGSYQLALVGADGKAEIRPVQVGPRVGTDWVIASGLKPAEQVIVEGIQKVRTGAPVTVKPWVPAARAQSEAK